MTNLDQSAAAVADLQTELLKFIAGEPNDLPPDLHDRAEALRLRIMTEIPPIVAAAVANGAGPEKVSEVFCFTLAQIINDANFSLVLLVPGELYAGTA